MLKKRLVPCIVTKGELVVQSFGFNKYLPIGDIKTAIEYFVNWDVDEIIVLDIDASREGRSFSLDLVSWAATECFVPLTIGGGISTQQHIRDLLKVGADKVCVNSVVRRDPSFIAEASAAYGSQCITVSIDVIETPNGYKVYDYLSKSALTGNPAELAVEMEALGAGEIFLNSVDRDGSRRGYDLDLLHSISSRLKIPVIACGGVGSFRDLAPGVTEGGCEAVSAANIFQHSEHSTIAAKAHLVSSGVDVRLSSNVKYKDFEFDLMGRPF
ncbi:HisA/HisF-related TIM barrel protein [Pseudomonadales bacterium]|nr:HisA/HisF-related TIM barrel protein [Pseudomonadales bacterium]